MLNERRVNATYGSVVSFTTFFVLRAHTYFIMREYSNDICKDNLTVTSLCNTDLKYTVKCMYLLSAKILVCHKSTSMEDLIKKKNACYTLA